MAYSPILVATQRGAVLEGRGHPPPVLGWGGAAAARRGRRGGFLIVGGFYSEVALQKREAEGTVRTKHQLDQE